MRFDAKVFDTAGLQRSGLSSVDRFGRIKLVGVKIDFMTSNNKVATVDQYGNITAHKAGTFTLTATAKDIGSSLEINVVLNPAVTLTLSSNHNNARTGDVIHFNAMAMDKSNKIIDDVPIFFSFYSRTDDIYGPWQSVGCLYI
jgi:hypothetical protein